jgi:RHS repeat-associated protein
VANPINPAMGAQVVSKTFLKVQGIIPITFTLTYNSILLTESVVGTGWGVNLYETSLRELSSGDVEVHWDANHANLFRKSGNQYSAVDRACRFDKLVKSSNGYTLSRQNKTIYEFNTDGQLLKLRNPNNQALTFQYDGAGRMTRVTEPVSGVYLNYTYNSYGLIATVTDPLNRQVRLGYDTNRHLTSVTDPANRVTKYTYNKFGQKLTTTLDGVLLSSNTYDPKGTGRIVAQEDNRSGNQPIHFDYNKIPGQIIITAVTGRDGEQRVYTYTENFQLLKLRDELGKTVTHTYDGNGTLTATTDAKGQTTRFTYDSQGNLTSVTNAANRTSEWSYDSNNNLLSSKNALAEITHFTYDGNNNLTNQTNPLGKVTRYTYNGYGQVVSMTNPRGKRTTYQYQQGRLVAMTDPNNQRQTLAYDAAGRVIKVTAPNGDATTLTYDAVDRVVAITDPLERTTRMTYNSRDNLLTLTDANGNIIRNSYDGNGNLISQTNALGQITRYEYDGEDRLIKVIDANNDVTQLSYDAKGHVIRTTNPLDGTRQITYDANDLPLTITDAEGQKQTLNYDVLGRLESVTDAEGFTTRLNYDALNRPTTITDPLNRTIGMTYNKNGQLLTIIDANGNVTERTYDDNDNMISQTDALGNQTRYEYDNNDQLIRVIDANNHATQLGYDAKGRLISITDALGRTRKLAYDKADNLLQQFDALGKAVKTITYDKVDNPLTITDATEQAVSFEYDKLNRLTRTTDPLKRVTEFQYDKLNRLVASVDALRGQSTQSFDANGNRTQLTDANQQKTQFSFDKSGRLVTETLASGSKLTYRYNARDLLTDMTNGRGQQRQFKYDYVGRLTQVTDPDGTISYTYDRNDNVLTVTDKNGTITREYDKRNRVIKYTDSQGNTIQYGYDAVGNLVTLTYPNGKAVRYEYDAVNQLTKVTDWAQRVTRYSYDANGRLTTVQRPNGTTMTRTYHATGQLAQQKDVTKNGEVISQFDFHYDAAGNISEEKMNPAPEPFPLPTVQMTYSAANRLASYDQQTVPYDADGNMEKIPLADALTTASFDSRNRLTQVGNTNYRYDAENQRITVDATHYVINPQAVLSQVLVKTTRDGTSTYYVYGLGLIGEETNGTYQVYHHDLRGSTVALTDASGTVVDRFHYSAFAQVVNHEGISDTPFLYNGRDGVMTDTNGLYYMRARYYNPEIRRFVNQDVLLGNVAEGQTLNRYAYVEGKPIVAVDPTGYRSWLLYNPLTDWLSDQLVAPKVNMIKAEAAITKQKIAVNTLANQNLSEEQRREWEAEFHKAIQEAQTYSNLAIIQSKQLYETAKLVQTQTQLAFYAVATVASGGSYAGLKTLSANATLGTALTAESLVGCGVDFFDYEKNKGGVVWNCIVDQATGKISDGLNKLDANHFITRAISHAVINTINESFNLEFFGKDDISALQDSLTGYLCNGFEGLAVNVCKDSLKGMMESSKKSSVEVCDDE